MTPPPQSLSPNRSRTALTAVLFALLLAACAPTATRDDAALTRLAFGSCLDQRKPQPIAGAVEAYRPELFVFLGDNVYGDVEDGRSDNLVGAYRAQADNAGFARLQAAPRVLAVWDDHDFGVNDGGGDFALKRQAEALFLDFWKVAPTDPRRSRDGLYASYAFGPPGRRVQVILLDTRYFRSPLRPTDQRGAKGKERYLPDESPDKTMLGAAQWRWLAAALEAPADLRLIGSSIQVAADGHGFERWGNLPRERARLYRLLAAAGDTPTIVISGDRHFAGLYRVPLDGERRLLEITASSLNRPFRKADEQDPNQIGAIYAAENFGTIEIDWPGRRATVAIRDIDGRPVREETLALDD